MSDKGAVTTLMPPLGDGECARPKRLRSRFYVRHVLPSDTHKFVGRIYDLSIVAYHFESYAQLAEHADCKYAFDVNGDLEALVRRVESLNMVGDMLWPKPLPANFADFPISRYEWLTVSADVFLMRYISVVDCALILVNTVHETDLEPRKCSLENLKKGGVPGGVIDHLNRMLDDQGALRAERNARFHHGEERGFTQDDQSFRLGARFEAWGGGLTGCDRFGRKLNIERSFREGLVNLQGEFNRATRKLVRNLNLLYDLLFIEFETRFSPRFRAGPFGHLARRK
ncbi:MAG: hypothetical protein AB1744_03555 [Candidatus Zixiibacteriota bacterium]